MKVNETDVMKLKQLDRIEFRQRYNEVEKRLINFGSFQFFLQMIYIWGYMILISLILLVGGYSESSSSILGLTPVVLRITIIIYIILFSLDLCSIYKNNKEKRILLKEYFDDSIKIRKSKCL